MVIGRWMRAMGLVRSIAHGVHTNAQAGMLLGGLEHNAVMGLAVITPSVDRIVPETRDWGWIKALSGALLASFAGCQDRKTHADMRHNDPSSLVAKQELEFLEEVERDPRAAVVGLFTLPLLSLSLGYQPKASTMEAGAKIVESHVLELEPWEIVVLLWGSARMGLTPSEKLLDGMHSVLVNSQELTACETTSAIWALCLLDRMPDDTWNLFMGRLARLRVDEFDEASILHLLQAAMIYTSKTNQYSKRGEIRPPKQELEKTLSPLSSKIVQRCMDAHYEFVPFHPYLDGPYLTMSFMMQMLGRFDGNGPTGPKPQYSLYLGGLSSHDLDRAKKTLLDSRKLSQLKRELFYQWRGNEVVDKWQQVVNEVVFLLAKSLGNIVDQPLDCDISLPQRKVAIFIEDDRPRAPVQNLKEASEGMLHLFGTETATPTSGFALHECPGTKLAKRQMLQRQGWRVVVIPFSVWDALSDVVAKQNLLQDVLATGELQEGMSSLFQSAMRR